MQTRLCDCHRRPACCVCVRESTSAVILFLARWFVRFSILSGKSGEQRENTRQRPQRVSREIVVKIHAEISHGWQEEREIVTKVGRAKPVNRRCKAQSGKNNHLLGDTEPTRRTSSRKKSNKNSTTDTVVGAEQEKKKQHQSTVSPNITRGVRCSRVCACVGRSCVCTRGLEVKNNESS